MIFYSWCLTWSPYWEFNRYEESKILPCLRANRSVCYDFTDADGSMRPPKSTRAGTGGHEWLPPKSQIPKSHPHWSAQKRQGGTRRWSGRITGEKPTVREPGLSWWAVGMSALCWAGGATSVLQGCLLQEETRKDCLQERVVQCREMWETLKKLSPSNVLSEKVLEDPQLIYQTLAITLQQVQEREWEIQTVVWTRHGVVWGNRCPGISSELQMETQ